MTLKSDPAIRLSSTLLTLILGGLQTVMPISTDLYLPALPTIANDLNVSPGTAQLTMAVLLALLDIVASEHAHAALFCAERCTRLHHSEHRRARVGHGARAHGQCSRTARHHAVRFWRGRWGLVGALGNGATLPVVGIITGCAALAAAFLLAAHRRQPEAHMVPRPRPDPGKELG